MINDMVARKKSLLLQNMLTFPWDLFLRNLCFSQDDKDIAKYFVSSGFVFVHADSSTEVCAVEAVLLEHLDPQLVKDALADYNAKLINAKDDYEKAAAQIGVEVANAMNYALEQK
jgi:F-type H+-transporting ATPase subunit delta